MIPAVQVIDDAAVIDSDLTVNDSVNADAWIDLRNWEGDYDRRLSGELYIDVLVSRPATGFSRAFRFKIASRTWWDFAWFIEHYIPANRFGVTDYCNLSGSETYADYYNCVPNLKTGDKINGDIYWRDYLNRPLFRGWPQSSGEGWWHNPDDFDFGTLGTYYADSEQQTKGGSHTNHHPRFKMGIQSNSPDMQGPNTDMVVSTTLEWYAQHADLVFAPPSANTAYRILFRNDLDTDDDGSYEEGSRVASAITESINDGTPADTGDEGIIAAWEIPFDKTNMSNIQAAFWGDTMKVRHERMINEGADLWDPDDSWITGAATACTDQRVNDPTTPTYRPYDENDITFDFLFVPSRNEVSSGCNGTRTGIIFVYGDVLVSGILNGNITLVSTGDIYLDHEIEYEQSAVPYMPENNPDPDKVDMLMLIAGGNIVIPQSCPIDDPTPSYPVFIDDWSDREVVSTGGGLYAPTGRNDTFPIPDDFGSEDIHAVMVTFSHFCTVGSGTPPTVTCKSPFDGTLSADQKDQLATFRSGLYAMPRTCESGMVYSNPFTVDPWDNTPKLDETNNFLPPANQSGTLSIVGSIYEFYPGRLSYDFNKTGVNGSGDCNNGLTYTFNERINQGSAPATNGCHTMNFERVLVTYDPRLKFNHPTFPIDADAANGGIPYGRGSYKIVSWEMIPTGSAGCGGDCW